MKAPGKHQSSCLLEEFEAEIPEDLYLKLECYASRIGLPIGAIVIQAYRKYLDLRGLMPRHKKARSREVESIQEQAEFRSQGTLNGI
jgi:hypothetical protein